MTGSTWAELTHEFKTFHFHKATCLAAWAKLTPAEHLGTDQAANQPHPTTAAPGEGGDDMGDERETA